MKPRVLSGMQPSGALHVGNYFGMIKRMVEYQESADLFCFLADLHSITSVSDGPTLKSLIRDAAVDLLALGIDPQKSHFWVQSHVPQVTELAWILSCLTPFGLMERAHSFKDKVARDIPATLGLFSYPCLMAADILLFQSQRVPVGKDQKQHLEIARDIALKFNHQYGELFTLPEPDIQENLAVIPGTDGQKMSKSYGNTIPLFADAKTAEKAVMSIKTDSKGVADSKDPETCTVFHLYSLFASPQETAALAEQYKKGGLGYGEAKKRLLEKYTAHFAPMQIRRRELASNPSGVDRILQEGAEKTGALARVQMEKIRKAVGIS